MTVTELAAAAAEHLPAGTGCRAEGTTLTLDLAGRDWLAGLAFARDVADCDFFDWLSAVDEPGRGFTVVAHVYSTARRHHLLLRTLVPREEPALASATGIYRGAAWPERETHEMFGVIFEGHPGLAPLLLPDGFEGYPLRKEFTLAARAARAWPGAVEPGERQPTARSRRRLRPPGVPEGWEPA
jgi:NADH-quinone oxidoreductase subunit C